MLKDSREYHYITEIIKKAEKEIERFLPTRMDDLYNYIDYEDIKKVVFLVNKEGFKLSEKDLKRFFY